MWIPKHKINWLMLEEIYPCIFVVINIIASPVEYVDKRAFTVNSATGDNAGCFDIQKKLFPLTDLYNFSKSFFIVKSSFFKSYFYLC